MPDPDDFVTQVRKCLSRRRGFSEKRMFGGTGFLLNGNMCCGVHKGRLILRLGADAAEEALTLSHVKPFDITGRAMTGWVMIGERFLNGGEIRDWVAQAAKFAGKLEPK